MKGRRQFLRTLGASTVLMAGCTTVDPIERQPAAQQAEEDSGGVVDTPGNPSAEPPSNEDKIDVELPGDPERIHTGQLPVYQVEEVINDDADGFDTGLGSGTERVQAGRNGARLGFAPEHSGSGTASGYATGTYRTAWTAPENGTYQLKAMFNRWGEFGYNLPPRGEIMSSFDVNAQVINYDTSTVVADQRFPQPLQSSNRDASTVVGEFLIETAIAALVGYSLGLGLVARVLLQQVVDELIQLEDRGSRGSQYDVTAGVERARSPINIGGPFEVTEGTTVVFEISPMLSWSYRLEDFVMAPQFDANFEMQGFQVTQID